LKPIGSFEQLIQHQPRAGYYVSASSGGCKIAETSFKLDAMGAALNLSARIARRAVNSALFCRKEMTDL
jgi:hypothetical protein